MILEEKEELKREIIYVLDESTFGLIEKIRGETDERFFKEISFARRIYNFFGYELSSNLYKQLLSIGIKKTHLSFEEQGIWIDIGEQEADFFFGLFVGGRKFIENMVRRAEIEED